MERLLKQTDNNPQALLSLLHSQQQTLRAQRQRVHSQHLEIESQSERIEQLAQQLDWFKRQVFGRKSERMVLPGQGELFEETALEDLPPAEEEIEQVSYARRKPKRNPLPKDLPRERIELSESTVNDAVLQSAQVLSPLAEALKDSVLGANRLFTDDTPVRLKSNTRGESREARFWVYVRQGEDDPPATVFDFTTDRSRDGPVGFLARFEGYLQADAYPGYDGLYAEGTIVEVGCWAHARRYFEKAANLHKRAGRAHVALSYIRKLFMIPVHSTD